MKSIICIFLFVFPAILMGQTPMLNEWLWPQYTLERNAENVSPGFKKAPQSPVRTFGFASDPILFQGKQPTERLLNLIPGGIFPQEAFTIELWVKDHVNQSVGFITSLKGVDRSEAYSWVLSYYNKKVYGEFVAENPLQTVKFEERSYPGYKKYFHHLVLTFDGKEVKLFLNGTAKWGQMITGQMKSLDQPEFEIAAYMQNEPYMQLGNLLHHIRVWDEALSEEEVRSAYNMHKTWTEAGLLFPDSLHFNAGPYLHFARKDQMNIVWETDQPTRAVIEYGESLPLDQKAEINSFKKIHEFSLKGLEPNTNYLYQIIAETKKGEKLGSGNLSFQTAVEDSAAFSFAVFGDTEARPHINDRMAKLIWDERPHFMINLGDLTDGGREPNKFEWNHEYFHGMTQLNSRIPVFPVPGNGEGDLFWYKAYHLLPEHEEFYSFTYGNAEFFMMNTNNKEELKPGGLQYEWLKEKLAASTASWKFACHHHPVWTSDENDYGNTWFGNPSKLGDTYVQNLIELYEANQVDMVMYGHLHTYERSWPLNGMEVKPENGVVYLVAGGAGGNLEDFAPTRSWFTSKLYRGHHYCKLDIFGGQLFFKMYDLNGALKDYMEIKK